MADASSSGGRFRFQLVQPVKLPSPGEFLAWVNEKFEPTVPVPSVEELAKQVPPGLGGAVKSLASMVICIDELDIETGDKGHRRFGTSVSFKDQPLSILQFLELGAIGFRVEGGPGTGRDGATTTSVVVYARVADHPLNVSAVIAEQLAFVGKLEKDKQSQNPLTLASLLQALLPGTAPGETVLPRIELEALTARYDPTIFALTGDLTIGDGEGAPALGFAFGALETGGSVAALRFKSQTTSRPLIALTGGTSDFPKALRPPGLLRRLREVEAHAEGGLLQHQGRRQQPPLVRRRCCPADSVLPRQPRVAVLVVVTVEDVVVDRPPSGWAGRRAQKDEPEVGEGTGPVLGVDDESRAISSRRVAGSTGGKNTAPTTRAPTRQCAAVSTTVGAISVPEHTSRPPSPLRMPRAATSGKPVAASR